MSKSRIAVVAAAVASMLIVVAAPAQATYHGKPSQIVFQSGGDIWGVRPTGKARHRILHDRSGSLGDPSVSPNGSRIAFEFASPTTNPEIFTADFHGHHLRWITKRASKTGNYLRFVSPTWSPNGKRLAFVCNTFNFNQICTTGRRGGKVKRIFHCRNCALGELDWGKGGRIVFVNGLKLWTVSGHGGHAHKLHIKRLSDLDSQGYQHPSWKPNGKTIVFQTGDSNTAVDTVSANGGHHKRVRQEPNFGEHATDYTYPVWSPNGKKIALAVQGLGPKYGGLPLGIYLMNPNGSGLKRISHGTADQYPQLFWATK